jgi:hypothetical protein
MFQTTKKLNPWLLTKKDTRNTGIDKKAQAGNSRSEDKLILYLMLHMSILWSVFQKNK